MNMLFVSHVSSVCSSSVYSNTKTGSGGAVSLASSTEKKNDMLQGIVGKEVQGCEL